MQIYLIRHGETDWNKKLLIQGISDKLLNDTGRQQAQAIAHYFDDVKPTKLVTSPLSRAKETLSIIQKSQKWELKPVENKRFMERDFGELEGKDVKAYNEVSDLSKYKLFEQDKQIQKRVSEGIEEIIKNSKEEDTVLITCHSHTIKSFLVNYFPKKYDYNYRLKNCVIIKVSIKDKDITTMKEEIVN